MTNQAAPHQRFRTVLVNVFWIPGLCLMLAGLLVPVYYWWSCPQSPDPASGHVIAWSRRGAHIYVTAAEQNFELALCASALALFVPGYFLRRRWNMLPEALVGPDYERIRATYEDK